MYAVFLCTFFLLNACRYLNYVLFTIKFVLLHFGLIKNEGCDRKYTHKKNSLIKWPTGIKQHIQNTNIRIYLCRHLLHCMKDWGEFYSRDRRGCDRMFARFTTTYPPSIRVTCTLCDQVCSWLATGRWFFSS